MQRRELAHKAKHELDIQIAMKEENRILEKRMQESYAVHIEKDVKDFEENQKKQILDKKDKNLKH